MVDLLEGVKPIECKWVFKKKIDMDGNLQTFKGRLVVKDYRQIYGIDYDENYALVARLEAIRMLLTHAYSRNFKLI